VWRWQHEVDERARELRAVADQHGKPRGGPPSSPFEVDDAERRPEIPVRLRREGERPRSAAAMNLDVVVAALPPPERIRAGCSEGQQTAVATLLDDFELDAQLLESADCARGWSS
jgi:hypothetical protein